MAKNKSRRSSSNNHTNGAGHASSLLNPRLPKRQMRLWPGALPGPDRKNVQGPSHPLTSKQKKGNKDGYTKGQDTPRRGQSAGGDRGNRFCVLRDQDESSVSMADVEAENIGGRSSTKPVTFAAPAAEDPNEAAVRIALKAAERHAERGTDAPPPLPHGLCAP